MSPEKDTPEDPALREEIMRQSFGDHALFELNLERLEWEKKIASAHGPNNLTAEEQDEFIEFNQRLTARQRKLREEGIIDPEG